MDKNTKKKNLTLIILLAAFAVLIYFITIARMSNG